MSSSVHNWANLEILKSPMYLDQKDTDTARDAALVLLGQMVTAEMICFMDNNMVNHDMPPMALVRACLKQCCYEWKQRKTPGLSSVQMQDGSVTKYQVSEWLKEVEAVLKRHRRFALYETGSTTVYQDSEVLMDTSDPPAVGVPSPPIIINTIPGDATVLVSWQDVSDADTYNLYYREGTTVTKNSGIKVEDVSSPYQVSGLKNPIPFTLVPTSYAFAVVAVNEVGESGLSNIAISSPTGGR